MHAGWPYFRNDPIPLIDLAIARGDAQKPSRTTPSPPPRSGQTSFRESLEFQGVFHDLVHIRVINGAAQGFTAGTLTPDHDVATGVV